MNVSLNEYKEWLLEELGDRSESTTAIDLYKAITRVMNRLLTHHDQQTQKEISQSKQKQMYYLSMEFLLGRLLQMNLMNYGLLEQTNKCIRQLGLDPERVYEIESDPGLGNGGLGRLAACFLDSLAALQLPGHGFGIRYHYGLFKQKFVQGNQVELKDEWLKEGYAWEMKRNEPYQVRMNGHVYLTEKDGYLQAVYENCDVVQAIPYDILITGYQNQHINRLRLWDVEENEQGFEEICGFLYPDDSTYDGKMLRLKQQYFLVSLSMQNIVHTYKQMGLPITQLPEKIIIQINDTHPSLAIPEMMRILMDEEKCSWNEAWKVTTKVFAYTNHTTLQEALEVWPEGMVQTLIPRIHMIISEINTRFCKQFLHDVHLDQLAVIEGGYIHMARLAMIGSSSINGVSQLHTDILKKQVMKPFYDLYPDKFYNQTNGISHRKWLLQINPRLANLITTSISSDWVETPKNLQQLLAYEDNQDFLFELDKIKTQNKIKLAHHIYASTGVTVDEHSIFDVHIKRIHEYKRQLLKVFHILDVYHALKEYPNKDIVPITFIFSGKAAANYTIAKSIIKLIHRVAAMIENDPIISKKIKVVFLENYSIRLAEQIIPAADLSEQISTAGKEASGTGNMKMMMNGALTIGTLDGANVEMKQVVGDEQLFVFGLTVDEIQKNQFDYDVRETIKADIRLNNILQTIVQLGCKDLIEHLLHQNDPYYVCKDFADYVGTNERAHQVYNNRVEWSKKSLINIAFSGQFSSDDTIRGYAEQIWGIKQKSET